eukprot:scaffold33380_cov27-Attheya_sp.AAC.1
MTPIRAPGVGVASDHPHSSVTNYPVRVTVSVRCRFASLAYEEGYDCTMYSISYPATVQYQTRRWGNESVSVTARERIEVLHRYGERRCYTHEYIALLYNASREGTTLLRNRVPALESVKYLIADPWKSNGFQLDEEVVAVVPDPNDLSLGLDRTVDHTVVYMEDEDPDPGDLYKVKILDRGVWKEVDLKEEMLWVTEQNTTDVSDSSSDSPSDSKEK